MTTVGVAGLGVVGGTLARSLRAAAHEVASYDPHKGAGDPRSLAGCEAVFVCVPTPAAPFGLDLTDVWSAVEAAGEHLDEGTVIALKSTVAPGTCDALATHWPRLDFASVPEFLVATDPQGTFAHPARLLIGARTDHAATLLEGILLSVMSPRAVVRMSPREAEMAKLCANVLLASKVAVANDLADACSANGVDWSVIGEVVGLDPRIGASHLEVTRERGFGGACLPKDLDGLIAVARGAGHEPALLDAIADYNRRIRASTSGDRAPSLSR